MRQRGALDDTRPQPFPMSRLLAALWRWQRPDGNREPIHIIMARSHRRGSSELYQFSAHSHPPVHARTRSPSFWAVVVMARVADDVDVLAGSLGVHVARYRLRAGNPARFRFFTEATDFFAGDGLGTVIGPRNALAWLRGFQAARTLCRERSSGL